MSRKRLNNENDTYYENLFERSINFKSRIVYINDDIDNWSLDLFQKAFDELEKDKEKPIRVEISSFGGSVYDMLGIVDRIKCSPCQIITRGFGKIMSAAVFILAAGDEREMGKNAWLMIHETADWMQGRTTDLKIEMKHLDSIEKQCNQLLEEYSSKDIPASTFKRLQKRNCYLNAKETLELGLIDKIIGEDSE